jgi:Glycosyltransferase family 87
MKIGNWKEHMKQAKYLDYVILLGLFVMLQVLLAFFVVPKHSLDNVDWYYDVANQMHRAGIFAVWTPYPPLFSVFLYVFSTVFAKWDSFFVAWPVWNAAMVLAIAFLIYKIVQRFSRETALACACGYVLINATINSAITIGLFFDQYDYLPIWMTLASLYLLMRDRPVASALLCGIGAMTKLFPAVFLPVAVLALPKQKRVHYVLFFMFACLIALLPWLITSPGTVRSFYDFYVSRDAWETIWTFPRLQFPPVPSPESFTVPFHADARPYSWLSRLAGVAALGCLWWHSKHKTERVLPRTLFSLLLVLLIFSKGVSSYFIFWVFPLLFIIYRPVSAFLICMALLLVGNIEFAGGTIQTSTYWVTIFGRHVILLGLLIESLFDGSRVHTLGRTYPANSPT